MTTDGKIMNTPARVGTRMERVRRYVEVELENVTRETDGLNEVLTGTVVSLDVALNRAERLASAATQLVRHLSSLSALDDVAALLEVDE